MIRSSPFTRRQFVGGTLAAAVAGGGSWALAATGGDADWDCPLLGDIHFDKLEHHDLAWLEKDHPGDVRQVQNYSRVTREILPRLLMAVKQQIDAATVSVPMILQLGDLIEGLCGTRELAAQQANEAVELIQQANFGRPLLMIKGNHDITGPGAAEAYDQILVRSMQAPGLDEIRRAAFTQQRGGVLLVFYDAYDKGSLDWFTNLIAERKPERLVFLIHPPVVPYNARSTWHVFSKPTQAKERERLLDLLGSTRAVVLCGHLHKYCFLQRRTEKGSFLQLAISSVATDTEGRPKDELTGVDAYGPDLVHLEPNHSPETLDLRRALLTAEKSFIERFEYADVWGHALLHIRGSGFTADVFRGMAKDVWKSHDLTARI